MASFSKVQNQPKAGTAANSTNQGQTTPTAPPGQAGQEQKFNFTRSSGFWNQNNSQRKPFGNGFNTNGNRFSQNGQAPKEQSSAFQESPKTESPLVFRTNNNFSQNNRPATSVFENRQPRFGQPQTGRNSYPNTFNQFNRNNQNDKSFDMKKIESIIAGSVKTGVSDADSTERTAFTSQNNLPFDAPFDDDVNEFDFKGKGTFNNVRQFDRSFAPLQQNRAKKPRNFERDEKKFEGRRKGQNDRSSVKVMNRGVNNEIYSKPMILEELFSAPIFNSSKEESLDTETKKLLREYVPPVLESQVENSLVGEFKEPIVATKFEEYEPLYYSFVNANKIIRETVQHEYLVGKREKKEKIADIDEFIKNECDLMVNEIQSGDYKRYEEFKPKKLQLKHDYSKNAVETAEHILRMNPYIHPIIKTSLIENISKYVDA